MKEKVNEGESEDRRLEVGHEGGRPEHHLLLHEGRGCVGAFLTRYFGGRRQGGRGREKGETGRD